MKLKYFPACVAVIFLTGCSQTAPPTVTSLSPHQIVQAQNDLFLSEKSYDPWILVNSDPAASIPSYLPSGSTGSLIAPVGTIAQTFHGGQYDKNGVITSDIATGQGLFPAAAEYKQTLDLQTGTMDTVSETSSTSSKSQLDWQSFWKASDIAIVGDPESQQVTHAELFYLCGSCQSGSDHSVPPMGLSSNVYNGHIFWDAEIWMAPALLPQHPDLARSIIDYRFHRLASAKALAKEHGFMGAEFPWESAATGLEEAPEEFSHERHITADIAYAAWQYYLWSGDRNYLSSEAYPILSETANYWISRAKLGSDGRYHLANVIGPDESADQVTDDAWTNAIVKYNLEAATSASAAIGQTANPAWQKTADLMYIPFDSKDQMYEQFPAMNIAHQSSKQADTQMLIYPLNLKMSNQVAGRTLDYAISHTIEFGPAMTSSINAVIAARLGRAQQSLDLYHASYRPFMRGPWDAFAEKRTKSDVYFTTGMGGNLQVVLYGFAGLNIVVGNGQGYGKMFVRSGDASLYIDPHLPPGWTGLTVKGVRFRGVTFDVQIRSGNSATCTKVSTR